MIWEGVLVGSLGIEVSKAQVGSMGKAATGGLENSLTEAGNYTRVRHSERKQFVFCQLSIGEESQGVHGPIQANLASYPWPKGGDGLQLGSNL